MAESRTGPGRSATRGCAVDGTASNCWLGPRPSVLRGRHNQEGRYTCQEVQSYEQAAHLIDPAQLETINVLGPTIQFLTQPEELNAPCIMRGTIPAGVSVPLHSHADPETFLMISGSVEGLICRNDAFEWVRIGPGAIFHVPTDAKHAWRNLGQTPAGDDHRQHFEDGPFLSGTGYAGCARCAACATVRGRDSPLSERGRQIWLLEREAGGKRAGRDSSLKVRH